MLLTEGEADMLRALVEASEEVCQATPARERNRVLLPGARDVGGARELLARWIGIARPALDAHDASAAVRAALEDPARPPGKIL